MAQCQATVGGRVTWQCTKGLAWRGGVLCTQHAKLQAKGKQIILWPTPNLPPLPEGRESR